MTKPKGPALDRIHRPDKRDMPVPPFQEVRRGNTAYFFNRHKKGAKIVMPFYVKDKNTLYSAGFGFINIPAIKIQKAAENTQGPSCQHSLKSILLSFRIAMAVPGILGNNTLIGQSAFVNCTDEVHDTRAIGSGEEDSELGTIAPAEGLGGIMGPITEGPRHFKDMFTFFRTDMS
jgi:hypothetical protein